MMAVPAKISAKVSPVQFSWINSIIQSDKSALLPIYRLFSRLNNLLLHKSCTYYISNIKLILAYDYVKNGHSIMIFPNYFYNLHKEVKKVLQIKIHITLINDILFDGGVCINY